MSIPAAELTRDHVNHWVTLHRPNRDDTTGILLGVTHARTSTNLLVSVWEKAKRGNGGTFEQTYIHDAGDYGDVVTVTVGDRFVSPGETSTARPEPSKDYRGNHPQNNRLD